MLSCNFCKNKFLNSSNLLRHQKSSLKCINIQKAQNIEIKQITFQCSFCNKNMTTKQDLNRHLNICKTKNKLEIENLKQQLQSTSSSTNENNIVIQLQDEVKQLKQELHDLQIKFSKEKNKRYCIEDGCNTIASYNYKDEKKRLYCERHKKEDMINIVNKMCKECDLVNGSKKYDGYCCRCYLHIFPDKPVSRNFKTKERAVVDFIKFHFPNHKWIWNKRIQNGYSSKLPDLLCDLGHQIIIIEIDENQHETYDCSCENKRLMLLSLDVKHRPIVFIRFNPDEYINQEGDLIPSCWTIHNKTKILRVASHNSSHWKERLNVLKENVEYWLDENNKTEKIIEVIQLFYDQNF